MVLKVFIKRLRVIAFFLFTIPTFALLGSLLVNNYLVTYDFFFDVDYSKYVKDFPGNTILIKCSKNNDFCYDDVVNTSYQNTSSRIDKLNKCYTNLVKKIVIIENKQYLTSEVFVNSPNIKDRIREKFKNKDFIYEITTTDKKNIKCIKNYKLLNKVYSYVPYFFNFFEKVKRESKLATGDAINPFFYGETSISNVVKRYPINYVFKPLLFITVILMLVYWSYYNKIFKEIIGKRINYFTIFGILSAIFLFFHIIFLGLETQNELFQNFRRIIIILFILFELLAQIFLTKDIYKNKNSLINYCRLSIVYLKVIFVTIALLISFTVVFLLSIYNFESRIDYILEWNYFLYLLVFYYLSFLIWKKEI